MTQTGVRIDADLFWARLEKLAGCWLFNGVSDRYGIYVDEHGLHHVAHRLAYSLTKGVIPHGYVILHACDTPGCCNPEHLNADTPSRNAQDRVVKGRMRVRNAIAVAPDQPVVAEDVPAPVDVFHVMEQTWLTPVQVAAALGIAPVSAWTLIKTRQIESWRFGGVWRITQTALDKFIAASTDKSGGDSH